MSPVFGLGDFGGSGSSGGNNNNKNNNNGKRVVGLGDLSGGGGERGGGAGGGGGGGGGFARRGGGAAARGLHDDDDDDDDVEYYTGGEKSGMMVQDPVGGAARRRRDRVEELFESARRHGATQGVPSDLLSVEDGAGGGANPFQGRGRRLRDDGAGEVAPGAEEKAEDDSEAVDTPRVHEITFWNNGFTVDGGPLRRLDDPANRPILDSIDVGECPRELAPPNPLTPVHVNLIKKSEDYVPPAEPKYRAFQGSGRTLGRDDAAATEAPVQGDAPAREFAVDESQPMTRIQLRLPNGQRLVGRFNRSHTLNDVRNYILSTNPEVPPTLGLASAPPMPKSFTDMEQSVEAAGVCDSVILVKY